MGERQQALLAIAPVLNRLAVDPNARVQYELMSDALIWSDELPPLDEKGVDFACIRAVFRFRTTLMLGKPDERYRSDWDLLASLCPQWPGFLPERRAPDEDRIQLFTEKRDKLLADFEALDARLGCAPAADTSMAGR